MSQELPPKDSTDLCKILNTASLKRLFYDAQMELQTRCEKEGKRNPDPEEYREQQLIRIAAMLAAPSNNDNWS